MLRGRMLRLYIVNLHFSSNISLETAKYISSTNSVQLAKSPQNFELDFNMILSCILHTYSMIIKKDCNSIPILEVEGTMHMNPVWSNTSCYLPKENIINPY